jgi:hypothetical protein
MTEINPIISITAQPDCKNIRRKGEHVLRRINKDGTETVYRYAWRGGPRIHEDKFPDKWRVPNWRDFSGEIRRVMDRTKLRARQRGHEFTLTKEWLMDRFSAQQGCCLISGLPFDLTNLKGEFTKNPYKASIDRIDNSQGYTPENSRIVLTCINLALNEWGLDNFLRIAEAALAKQKGVK